MQEPLTKKLDQIKESMQTALDAVQNDPENAPALFEEAIKIAREQDDRVVLSKVLYLVADVLSSLDEAAHALELANESLQLCLEQDDYETLEEILRVITEAALSQGERAPIWEAYDRVARWTKRNRDWIVYLKALDSRTTLAHSIGEPEVRDAAFEERLEFAREQRESGLICETLARIAAVKIIDGELDEADRRARECLAAARGANSRDNIAKARSLLSQIAMQRDDFATSWSEAERAVAIARELEDPEILPLMLEIAALPSISLGERARGWRLLDESLDLHRQAGNDDGFIQNLMLQVRLAKEQGEPDRARARLEDFIQFARSGDTAGIRAELLATAVSMAQEFGTAAPMTDLINECVAEARESGDPEFLARALLTLADSSMIGRPEEAEDCVREAFEIATDNDDDSLRADALDRLAGIARAKGDSDRAIELLEERLDILKDLPGPKAVDDILSTLTVLVILALDEDDPLTAHGCMLEHLERAISIDLLPVIRTDLRMLATFALALEDMEQAARLHGAAAAINVSSEDLDEAEAEEGAEDNMKAVSTALGAERFNELFAEGQAMTPEEALQLASGAFTEAASHID